MVSIGTRRGALIIGTETAYSRYRLLLIAGTKPGDRWYRERLLLTQTAMVSIGTVEVCQGVGLCLLEELGRRRAEAANLPACQVVELANEARVPFGEDRMQDGERSRPFLVRTVRN